MSKKPIHVGDIVQFQLIGKPVRALVKEDFGKIGVGGRRLLGIQYWLEEPFVMEMDMPEDRLELVEEKRRGDQNGKQKHRDRSMKSADATKRKRA